MDIDLYEKKYKDAQKWIESIYTQLSHEHQMEAEAFFPELRESKDESIRKYLIKGFQHYDKEGKWGELTTTEILSWLEKQGKQKSKDKYTFTAIPRLLEMIEPTDRAKSYCQKLIDSLLQEGYATDAKIVSECLKKMNGDKVSLATMDEQNPTDKVEPKFKVGDWIACDELNTALIVNIDDYKYEVELVNGSKCVPQINYVDKNYHLWTIQDAEDGDVLVNQDGEMPFIFKSYKNDHVYCYCGYTNHKDKFFDRFVDSDGEELHWLNLYHERAYPATKEQRDLLFAKMKEAGYKWDAEKKELKRR